MVRNGKDFGLDAVESSICWEVFEIKVGVAYGCLVRPLPLELPISRTIVATGPLRTVTHSANVLGNTMASHRLLIIGCPGRSVQVLEEPVGCWLFPGR